MNDLELEMNEPVGADGVLETMANTLPVRPDLLTNQHAGLTPVMMDALRVAFEGLAR